MVNLLIVDYDLKFAKDVISNIIRFNDKLRLVDIATSTKEAINVISKYKPHIIILNVDVVDLKQIDNLKYKPKKILITSIHEKWIKENYILKSDFNALKSKVDYMLEKNDFAKPNEKLLKYLFKLKFNISARGTSYLMDCILYCYNHKNTYSFNNINKTLYSIIAKKNNTTANHVESDIKVAVNEMYNRNDIENSLDYVEDFFFIDEKVKPTTKIIIDTFMAKLR